MGKKFPDSYVMCWRLRKKNGVEYVEKHDEISMSDFEVIYGQNSDQILKMVLKRK